VFPKKELNLLDAICKVRESGRKSECRDKKRKKVVMEEEVDSIIKVQS